MKNIKSFFQKTTLSLLAISALGACDDFLSTPPQGQISVDAIKSDPNAAETLVTGVYNNLWDANMHGFSYVGLTNIASDDADKGSTAADGATTYGQMDNLTADPSNGLLNSVWSAYYRTIARANQALDKIPLSPATQDTRNRLTGEVRFLRAYCYFNLVRFWGGVTLLSNLPSVDELGNPVLQKRASKEETYALIISDLEYAKNNLPIKGNTSTAVGRATKGAAMGLLSKVFLYQKNYQRAFALADSVVKNQAGTYSLLPVYENIWRAAGANGSESLFEVQTGTNLSCNAAISLYTVCQGPRAGGLRGWTDLGFGFGGPSATLLAEYEAGDLRRNATVITISSTSGTVLWDGFRVPRRDSVENSFYNYKAYHSRTAEPNCGVNDRLPKNLRILRLAEVILIRAEAALALGNTATALTDVNALRKRAGLKDVANIDREKIWKERRVELALEHDRSFDLIRQEDLQPGRAVDAFKAHSKTFVKGKHELFPIPAVQIQLSGGALTQNPGY